jgi:predicted RecA/RadA family phage recombinase
MINDVQTGDYMTFTAPSGGVVTSLGYLIGSLFVIATVTAAQTEPFVGKTTGVISYTKPGSEAWAEGVKIYWDNSAKKMTTTSSGNTLVGVAAQVVGSGAGETTGKVRLDGVAR